jgi:predicted Zn-dependent protease
MRSVRTQEKVLDIPFAREYIQTLGNRLVKAGDADPQTDFNFFVLDNPQINAFAGPGGHIGVYTGLIETTQSESELAAVIAHEIAHVTQKHLLRTFHQTSQMGIPSAAVILAAIVLGATAGGDAGMAAAIGGQAALIQQQINFTRANEKEADSVGINTLFASDFEPHAMPMFFERMGRANRAYSSELPEFLRTHPVTTNRIADSLSRAEQHPYTQHQDDLHYHLLKALLKQRSFDDGKEAEKFFRTNLSEGRYRNGDSQRYGLVLSLMEQKNFDQALRELQPLLKSHPTEVVYQITRSQILSQTGQLKEAIASLESLQVLFPGDYALNIKLAELLQLNGQYDKAINLLQLLINSRPEDDLLYKNIARVAGDKGDKLNAHTYYASYLYLNGQLEQAIQQLEIALRDYKPDFYEASRIEAQLNAIRAEFNALKDKKSAKNGN